MTEITDKQANDLWGGRFAAGPAAIMAEINASIGFDQRLVAEDVAGSKAHCRMLVAQGIISSTDGASILEGLDKVLAAFQRGEIELKPELEDIHMHVETALKARIGEAAGRLHTARSRNDQVATDVRLFLRDGLDQLDAALAELLDALITRAEEEAATLLPGYTHLQAAQPVTFGHHLLAYAEMFERDRGRLADCRARMNESPLGAAALAGTSFPIDREMTAKDLGFARPMRNSMDAVAARDFALEFLAAGGILATHLSRLAEEIVIWMSEGFRFIALSDAFTTGSSIMPQKRNPDAAELVRGKAGRILGAFTALAVTVKGLPMTYGKDMQEDKEPLFDAVDNLALMLAASSGMIRDMTVERATMAAACDKGFLTATDLADWLVRVLGLPFRRAHHTTGRLVQQAEAKGCGLAELSLAEMQAVEPAITEEIYAVLTVESAVASRTSQGGTAPDLVRAAAEAARQRLEQAR
ncbi:MAG: argininosuccinate lyase [Pseudomonadota bacterium]